MNLCGQQRVLDLRLAHTLGQQHGPADAGTMHVAQSIAAQSARSCIMSNSVVSYCETADTPCQPAYGA